MARPDRADSWNSWTNPFSRFISLSTTVATSFATLRTSPAPEENDVRRGGVSSRAREEEGDGEDGSSGVPTASQPNSHNDPFNDSHAIPTKPLWHRVIVALTVLAAILALGLGLGLGIKKLTNKVGELEATRIESTTTAARGEASATTATTVSISGSPSHPPGPSSVASSVLHDDAKTSLSVPEHSSTLSPAE
ncbi:hypothetical protein JCM16303_004625 [Sporobolomyces ruberrimus]